MSDEKINKGAGVWLAPVGENFDPTSVSVHDLEGAGWLKISDDPFDFVEEWNGDGEPVVPMNEIIWGGTFTLEIPRPKWWQFRQRRAQKRQHQIILKALASEDPQRVNVTVRHRARD